MKEKILYIWFQLATGICNKVAGEVFIKFRNIVDIYNCDDFSFLGDKREKYIKRLENKDTAEAFEILKRCREMGVGVTGYYDSLYPDSLRGIDNPPAVLYSIGEFRDLNKIPCVGIVGTRNMTDYGKTIAEDFARSFAKNGIYVISGLAKGIDTAAHRGAVTAGGYTVAVLGNPIGEVYPKENLKAFETLYEKGLVISEMYPGCPRTKADFPNRNRIISGISDCVLIAEAGETSGSLITARHAVSQGRDVFAIPGAVGAANAGTNALIKQGISAATEPKDIISALVLRYPEILKYYEPENTSKLRSYGNAAVSPPPVIKVAAEEIIKEHEPEFDGSNASKILSLLKQSNSMTADEITSKTGLPVSEVLSELTLLEIEGEVSVSVGGRYTLSKA